MVCIEAEVVEGEADIVRSRMKMEWIMRAHRAPTVFREQL